MRGTKRILAGVATVALPVASVIIFGGPTIFAGASSTPAFPVACKITGDVAFTPPLTQTGTVGTNKDAVTTMAVTAGHLQGCLSAASATAPGHGTPLDQTIRIAATSVGSRRYATGYCPMFTATNVAKTLKAFKDLTFDISWTGGAGGTSVFTATKVSTTTNSNGELGLVFSGKQGVGSYAEKSLNEITEYFDATDSTALLTGCASAQTVSAPTFDLSNSVAIL